MAKARMPAEPGWIISIAIEDAVELRAAPFATSPSALPLGEPFFFSAEIDASFQYLTSVVSLVREGLNRLIKERFSSARDCILSLRAVVISTPGVVERNRYLLQLPLWNAPTRDALPWMRDLVGGRRKNEDRFDFNRETASILDGLLSSEGERWSGNERREFEDSIFVVNDATACAALEYDVRRDRPDAEDFVLLKIHNGINVGVVQRDRNGGPAVKTSHAEAGHGYPRLHQLDSEMAFQGICAHHHACFEGMIACHSLYERSARDNPGPFVAWKTYLDGRNAATGAVSAQSRDNDLAEYVLGHRGARPPDGGLGTELAGHYAGQLVHQLSLGPLVPREIVVSGKMASPTVLEIIRRNLVNWTNGYPKRRQFTSEGVLDHVVPSEVLQDGQSSEVRGAEILAKSRALYGWDETEDAISLKKPADLLRMRARQ